MTSGRRGSTVLPRVLRAPSFVPWPLSALLARLDQARGRRRSRADRGRGRIPRAERPGCAAGVPPEEGCFCVGGEWGGVVLMWGGQRRARSEPRRTGLAGPRDEA